MAFKEVAIGSMSYLALHKSPKDTSIAGVYTGCMEKPGKFKDIDKTYKVRGDDGEITGVNGFTGLDRKMEGIPVGVKIRLTYLGTENVNTKFGMKDVHQVKVEVDDEGVNTEVDEDL